MSIVLRLRAQTDFSALLPLSLTFLLRQSTRLADAVARQVAEDGLCVAAFPRQRHFLFHPVGGAAGQPGGEGLPPLQLLLIFSCSCFSVLVQICGAQPAPQGLAQRPGF